MTFQELEKRCKQRRLKRFFIYFGIFVFLIVLVLIFILNMKFLSHKEKINTISHNKISHNKIKIKKPVIKNKEKVNHIKKVNNNKVKENIILAPIIPDINISNTVKTPKTKPVKKIKSVKKENSKVKENNKTVKNNIQKTASLIKVESLPSYDKCINLAKKYLKDKKYNLALTWAKNANIQNKVLPDSWIITAKALFYSGKKEKAKEILRIYLNYNKNKKVEKLLKEFENEKNN